MSDWTPEQDNALRAHLDAGMSMREAASAINRTFKTSFTRSAAIGRAHRKGLSSLNRKMKSVLERAQRLARWAGLKVGAQPQLFEAAQVDHVEDGKTAGMSGDTCEPPKNLAMDAAQKWISGWHEGQTVLMSAFKKKRPVDGSAAAMDGQIDLEDAIVKFGDRVDLNDDEKAKGYTAAFVKDGQRVAMQVRT